MIGTLTSLIGEGDAVRSYVSEQLEAAQYFCDQKGLPKQMSQAILTHTRYHCKHNYIFDEDAVLKHLPPYLQMDISYYVAKKALNDIDFFRDISPMVRGSIALKMKSISCNAGYKLYKKGDLAQQIYIQRTGFATMITQKKNAESGELE